MQDDLDDVDSGDSRQCVDIFVQNAKFIGLLKTSEGAEFLSKVETASGGGQFAAVAPAGTAGAASNATPSGTVPVDFDNVCFFIAPIGKEGEEQRQHSDAILSSYVEHALSVVDPKLKVVRADQITTPGMITKQVIEYLLKSKLVVADLSYHNPNVFYELAVRHATGKPVVPLKRAADPLPFDNKDFRTIEIKFADKYEILAELETMRSTISQFVRQAVASGDNSDNPLLIYFPDHRLIKSTK